MEFTGEAMHFYVFYNECINFSSCFVSVNDLLCAS